MDVDEDSYSDTLDSCKTRALSSSSSEVLPSAFMPATSLYASVRKSRKRRHTLAAAGHRSTDSDSRRLSAAEMRVDNDFKQLKDDLLGVLRTRWAIDFLDPSPPPRSHSPGVFSASASLLPTTITAVSQSESGGVTTTNKMHFELLVCCSDGPFKEGVFGFRIDIPQRYPFEAPIVTCMNRIFHPNISREALKTGPSSSHPRLRRQARGEGVCEYRVALDLIDRHWTPKWTVSDVIHAVQFTLLEPALISEGSHRRHGPGVLTHARSHGVGAEDVHIGSALMHCYPTDTSAHLRTVFADDFEIGMQSPTIGGMTLPSLILNREAADLFETGREAFNLVCRRNSEPLASERLFGAAHDIVSDLSLLRSKSGGDTVVRSSSGSGRLVLAGSRVTSASPSSSGRVMLCGMPLAKDRLRHILGGSHSSDTHSDPIELRAAVHSRRNGYFTGKKAKKRKRDELELDDSVIESMGNMFVDETTPKLKKAKKHSGFCISKEDSTGVSIGVVRMRVSVDRTQGGGVQRSISATSDEDAESKLEDSGTLRTARMQLPRGFFRSRPKEHAKSQVLF